MPIAHNILGRDAEVCRLRGGFADRTAHEVVKVFIGRGRGGARRGADIHDCGELWGFSGF